MFAVIKLREPRRRFGRGTITSERITLPSGEAFFIVTVEKAFGRVPWKKLEGCLGILKRDVILPKEVAVPSNVGITEFVPDIFPGLLLMNSALYYIESHKNEFTSRSLTVFEDRGAYIDYIENLARCFATIKVVTQNSEEYEKLSLRLMEKYGFSLVITDKECFDSDVIIARSCDVPLYFAGTVFADKKKFMMNSAVFSGSDVVLPEPYEKLKPEGVGRVAFASALYEKCAQTQLQDLKYADFGC